MFLTVINLEKAVGRIEQCLPFFIPRRQFSLLLRREFFDGYLDFLNGALRYDTEDFCSLGKRLSQVGSQPPMPPGSLAYWVVLSFHLNSGLSELRSSWPETLLRPSLLSRK